MKKIVLIIALMATTLLAQQKFTEFKAGLISPAGAKTGFWGGITMGRAVDNNVGVSLALDIYRRSYTKETEIGNQQAPGGDEEDIVARELDQSTTMIPLFFQIQYQGPMTPLFNLRVTAGLGYELLWSSVTNYYTKEDDTDFYSGFGWHIGAGAAYVLSRNSDLFAEVSYHSGSPSRDKGETVEGLPVRGEIDMGGLGFRVGIRIYNFGF